MSQKHDISPNAPFAEVEAPHFTFPKLDRIDPVAAIRHLIQGVCGDTFDEEQPAEWETDLRKILTQQEEVPFAELVVTADRIKKHPALRELFDSLTSEREPASIGAFSGENDDNRSPQNP